MASKRERLLTGSYISYKREIHIFGAKNQIHQLTLCYKLWFNFFLFLYQQLVAGDYIDSKPSCNDTVTIPVAIGINILKVKQEKINPYFLLSKNIS